MQPVEAAEVLLAKAAEVGATVVREGFEFGVVSRRQAVGGQLLTLQGLGGIYDDIFLQPAGPAPGVATPPARWRPSRRSSAAGPTVHSTLRRYARGSPRADSPGRLEVVRRNPTVLLDGAHNPAGAQALADRHRRRLRLHPAGRRGRACWPTRTSAACSRRSNPCSAPSS